MNFIYHTQDLAAVDWSTQDGEKRRHDRNSRRQIQIRKTRIIKLAGTDKASAPKARPPPLPNRTPSYCQRQMRRKREMEAALAYWRPRSLTGCLEMPSRCGRLEAALTAWLPGGCPHDECGTGLFRRHHTRSGMGEGLGHGGGVGRG